MKQTNALAYYVLKQLFTNYCFAILRRVQSNVTELYCLI